MSEYGRTTTGGGSARRPALRVLAMTPMMVTSGGRAVSASVRVGGRSRRPSRSRAPIGFSPAGQSLAAASLITRDPIAAPDLGRIEHPAATQRDAERAQVIGPDQVDRDPLRFVGDLTHDRER